MKTEFIRCGAFSFQHGHGMLSDVFSVILMDIDEWIRIQQLFFGVSYNTNEFRVYIFEFVDPGDEFFLEFVLP